jgi:hypothetical protein
MKKLLLGLLFILFSVVTFAQNNPYQQQTQKRWAPDPNSIPLTNITLNQVQNGWAQMGNSCAGCPSYFYQVLITQQAYQAEDGQYYYYYFLKFYSNSHYANGSAASTYLSQVNYFMNGNQVFFDQYILVAPGQALWGPSWVRSPNQNTVFLFTVAQMSVY